MNGDEKNSKDSNLFSLNNMDEIIELENHLCFIEEMINKYPWTVNVKADLQKRVDKLREKQQDKKLNLSVIGEFSTGKSTFINALLRTNLLAMNSLQGTTVASTVIEETESYQMEVRYKDGREEEIKVSDLEQLKERIHEFTTVPENAQKLSNVHIGLPTSILSSQIRIIDTPGTNADEVWHEEVTVRAIQEISDASVILISASQPMTASLVRFIDENLREVLGQCIFVVTKIDAIRPRERKRIIQYVKLRLEQEFGLKNPLVLPYASLFLVEEDAESSYNDREELLEMVHANEAEICRYIVKQRAIAQTKKLLMLMDEVYARITAYMQRISSFYMQERAMLERTQRTDLSVFVNEQKQKRSKVLEDEITQGREVIYQYLTLETETVKNLILSEISSQANIDALWFYVEKRVPVRCDEEAQRILKEALKFYIWLENTIQKQMEEFYEEFRELYQRLAILPIEKIITQNQKLNVLKYREVNTATINTLVMRAATGNALSANKYEKTKAKVLAMIKQPLDECYEKVIVDMMCQYHQNTLQMKESLLAEIDKYIKTYQKSVQDMIILDDKKKVVLDQQIRNIRQELSIISNRRFGLQSMKEKMDMLNGEEKNG